MSITARIVIALVVGVVLLTTASGQTCQNIRSITSSEILSRRVDNCTTFNPAVPFECVNFDNTTMRAVLNDSLAWMHIPVGAAFPSSINPQSRYTFAPSNHSVRDVLDSIIVAEPRYSWIIEDGVINLMPIVNYPTLMDVRISEFKAENVTVRTMFEALENAPEVRDRAAELGFDEAHHYPFMMGIADMRRYNIDCPNCSVRQVLNTIARLNGDSWMYAEYNYDGRKTYSFSYL